MIQILKYTVEAGIIFGVFQYFFSEVYYSLCYNKWNRIYLIAGTFASYLLPLLKIEYFYETDVNQNFKILEIAKENGFDTITISREKTFWNEIGNFFNSPLFETLVEIVFAVYAAGVAVNLFVFLRGLHKTLKLKQNPLSCELDGGIKVYKTELNTVAFSFFKNIFTGKKAETLTQKDLETVFSHEKQHIKGRHSVDTLIFGLFGVLQWFNPYAKKAAVYSKNVCENIADCNVSEEKGLTEYSKLVLRLKEKHQTPQKSRKRSRIAERLLMLLNSEEDKIRKIRFVFSTGVLAIAVAAYVFLAGMFSKTEKGLDIPFKGEYTVSAEYFEQHFYVNPQGVIYEVSHPQTDICVKETPEISVPEGFSVKRFSDGEITFSAGDTVITIGGLNKSDTLIYIKTQIGNRIVNPRKIFKL